MLTTRTHRLAEPSVVMEDDGAVIVKASDRLQREHMAGRMKGAIEHTDLQFHFDTRHDALLWLNAARDLVANAEAPTPATKENA